MNIIDIVILAILGVSLFSGMHKGFITSGLVVLGFIAAWFGAQATYGMLSGAILSNSSLMSVLSNYLEAGNLFGSAAVANATITDALGGAGAFNTALGVVSEKLPFLADAFANNVRGAAFESLQIFTLGEYLDQTIWTAVFQLLSFVLLFFVYYAVATLLANLLSRVFRFPALRGFDALAGGVFGLLRGAILVMLLIAIVPMITEVVKLDAVTRLTEGSRLTRFFGSLDVFNIRLWVESLMA